MDRTLDHAGTPRLTAERMEQHDRSQVLVSVCGWCPDSAERTAELKARGLNVTHGICDACMAKWKQS
jgi:hypothetical protein